LLLVSVAPGTDEVVLVPVLDVVLVGAVDPVPLFNPVGVTELEPVAEAVTEPEPVEEAVSEPEPVADAITELEPVAEAVIEPGPVAEGVPESEDVSVGSRVGIVLDSVALPPILHYG
jgi:hypothetical protein